MHMNPSRAVRRPTVIDATVMALSLGARREKDRICVPSSKSLMGTLTCEIHHSLKTSAALSAQLLASLASSLQKSTTEGTHRIL